MAQRQHSDAPPSFVNRQERTSLDGLSVRFECVDNDADGSVREQILSTELDDARPSDGARGEDCREVQVVGDQDELVLVRRGQDLDVRAVGAPMVD